MDFIIAVFTILFIVLLGLLPFFLIYFISDLIYFFLLRVIKYRKDVMKKNLHDTFPEKSDKEINKIVKGVYKNIADITVESLKAFTMRKSQFIARHKLLNPELVDTFYSEKRSVIAVPAHYGNWEWGSISGSLQLPHNCIVLYKPFSNKWMDKYARRSRSKFGSTLVSIYLTAKIFHRHQDENCVFIMAADQSPSNIKKAIWANFLDRETAFLHGPEFYARKYNLPVVFVDILRVKRGYYELTLETIADNPNALEPGEITQRYANSLEKAILRKPQDWLWTHKRWKHSR